tara:strand:- start:1511 stop:1840 length:330 start_codon:yes stop_codon:yes gene_type:complete
MKLHRRDAHPETGRVQSPKCRRRGVLEPKTPDGSWADDDAALIKGIVALAAATGFFWLAPSFTGWSFGDEFLNGKIGFATWMMAVIFAVAGGLNVAAALGGGATALFGR